MHLLLDTHVLIWWFSADQHLSKKAISRTVLRGVAIYYKTKLLDGTAVGIIILARHKNN